MNKQECVKHRIEECYARLLQTAVALSEDAVCKDLISRNLLAIEEFLHSSCGYVAVRDLRYIIRLVNSVYHRCKQYDQYVPYLIRLLDLCCFPPILHKSSDVIEYANDISQYLSMFGYMLVSTENNEILNALCSGLERLFNIKDTPICCINQRILNEILAQSQLPLIVADVIHIANNSFYITLLSIMENFLQSDDTCRIFLKKKLISLILERMYISGSDVISKVDLNTFRPPVHFYLSIKIVWRLSEVYRKTSKKFQEDLGFIVLVPAWEGCRLLCHQLVLAKGYKKERNTMLRLIFSTALGMKCAPCYPLTLDAVLLAGATENGTLGTWAAHVVFTNDDDDFELKLWTMSSLCYYRQRQVEKEVTISFPQQKEMYLFNTVLCGDVSVPLNWENRLTHLDVSLCTVTERVYGTVLSLLKLVSPEIKLIWTHGQRMKLMKHALLCFECIIPHVLDDFIRYEAPNRLMRLFISIVNGELPTYHLAPCLRCILRSLITGVDLNVATKFRSEGATEYLLSYIKEAAMQIPLSIKRQGLLLIMFCILHHLNRGYKCTNQNVVPICIDCITRFQKPSDGDCFLDPKIMIGILDYLWEHIMCWDCGRDVFIQSGGVYLLLDVLEQFPIAVKLVTLNILVDLTQEGKIFSYLGTWHGEKYATLISLLLEIFRMCDDKYENVTSEGMLKDPHFPLIGAKLMFMTQTTFQIPGDYPSCSPVCLDFLGNTRPKVYALLQMIQCSPLEPLIREHYKQSDTTLSNLDKVTMPIAEHYLALKMYEAWDEMNAELERQGVNCLKAERVVLEVHIQRSSRWAVAVQRMQREVLATIAKQEIGIEQRLYERIRDQTLSEALSTLDEMKKFANTMDQNFRRAAKTKETTQICKSRTPFIDTRLNFHATYNHEANFTSAFNQKVNIRSNIVIDPNEQKVRIVSESTSLENCHSMVHGECGFTHREVTTSENQSTDSDEISKYEQNFY